MDPEAYSNMVLKPDFSHLSGVMTKTNMLREWGGEINFSLEDYINWRAEEEGVVELLDKSIRRYTGAADQVNPLAEDVGALTSYHISHSDPPARKMGSLWKRGSGVGFFSSFKWKQKLFCVGPGGVMMYFDSNEISETNKASRIMQLAGSYVEPLPEGMDSKQFGFQVVAPSRSFVLSCSSRDEYDAWLEAFTEEISIANKLPTFVNT